jgi:hypothetical protein
MPMKMQDFSKYNRMMYGLNPIFPRRHPVSLSKWHLLGIVHQLEPRFSCAVPSPGSKVDGPMLESGARSAFAT